MHGRAAPHLRNDKRLCPPSCGASMMLVLVSRECCGPAQHAGPVVWAMGGSPYGSLEQCPSGPVGWSCFKFVPCACHARRDTKGGAGTCMLAAPLVVLRARGCQRAWRAWCSSNRCQHLHRPPPPKVPSSHKQRCSDLTWSLGHAGGARAGAAGQHRS